MSRFLIQKYGSLHKRYQQSNDSSNSRPATNISSFRPNQGSDIIQPPKPAKAMEAPKMQPRSIESKLGITSSKRCVSEIADSEIKSRVREIGEVRPFTLVTPVKSPSIQQLKNTPIQALGFKGPQKYNFQHLANKYLIKMGESKYRPNSQQPSILKQYPSTEKQQAHTKRQSTDQQQQPAIVSINAAMKNSKELLRSKRMIYDAPTKTESQTDQNYRKEAALASATSIMSPPRLQQSPASIIEEIVRKQTIMVVDSFTEKIDDVAVQKHSKSKVIPLNEESEEQHPLQVQTTQALLNNAETQATPPQAQMQISPTPSNQSLFSRVRHLTQPDTAFLPKPSLQMNESKIQLLTSQAPSSSASVYLQLNDHNTLNISDSFRIPQFAPMRNHQLRTSSINFVHSSLPEAKLGELIQRADQRIQRKPIFPHKHHAQRRLLMFPPRSKSTPNRVFRCTSSCLFDYMKQPPKEQASIPFDYECSVQQVPIQIIEKWKSISRRP